MRFVSTDELKPDYMAQPHRGGCGWCDAGTGGDTRDVGGDAGRRQEVIFRGAANGGVGKRKSVTEHEAMLMSWAMP